MSTLWISTSSASKWSNVFSCRAWSTLEELCSCFAEEICFGWWWLAVTHQPRSTLDRSSAASDVYKRHTYMCINHGTDCCTACGCPRPHELWSTNRIRDMQLPLSQYNHALHTKPVLWADKSDLVSSLVWVSWCKRIGGDQNVNKPVKMSIKLS